MSKTQDNLKAAFAGESQARNKYTYFAKAAKKEGYHYIAKLFLETAEDEKRHAKDLFYLLKGLNKTEDNLTAAIEGENYETESMYPDFAKQAEEEGDKDAAFMFRQIAGIEAHHRDRYKKLLEMVKNGTVYKRDEPIKWKCAICGHIHTGQEPPAKCPCCKHPREHYEPANLDL